MENTSDKTIEYYLKKWINDTQSVRDNSNDYRYASKDLNEEDKIKIQKEIEDYSFKKEEKFKIYSLNTIKKDSTIDEYKIIFCDEININYNKNFKFSKFLQVKAVDYFNIFILNLINIFYEKQRNNTYNNLIKYSNIFWKLNTYIKEFLFERILKIKTVIYLEKSTDYNLEYLNEFLFDNNIIDYDEYKSFNDKKLKDFTNKFAKKHLNIIFNRIKKDDMYIKKITIAILQVIEKCKLLEVTNENFVKTFTISNVWLDLITKWQIICDTKLPMLVEPIPYNTDNMVGGYLISKEQKFNEMTKLLLGHKDNAVKIQYNKNYLENINYIQKQKIYISSNMITSILQKSINYVKEIINIDLTILDEKTTKFNFNLKINARIFLSQIYYAIKYSDIPIYLNWGCDGRGRIYNINSPLNFYSNKIIRSFFTFYTPSKTKNCTLPNNKKLTISEQNHLECYQENCLIGIDATASVYQIMGGLTLDKNILKRTNVLPNNDIMDIYTDIIIEFKNNLNYEYIKEEYIKVYNTYSGNKQNLESPMAFINCIKNYGRKEYKKYIMTYGYNQGNENMAIDLMENYGIKQNKMLKNIFKYIIKTLTQTIEKMMPKIKILRRIFNKIIKECIKENKQFINLSLNNKFHKITQKYLLLQKKQYKYKIPFTDKRQSVYYQTYTDQYNIKKNIQAALPNYIHYLDCIILMKVIDKCRKEKINLLPIHDCFYTHIENLEIIKTFYKESYIKVVIEQNNLLQIIENNEINKSIFSKKELEIITKKDVIQNLENKIINSKNILC